MALTHVAASEIYLDQEERRTSGFDLIEDV